MTRQQAGFAGVVRVPHGDQWPRPRGFANPAALDAGIETLAGVGPTLAKRLRALGIESVADLLFHRPRRYERAADEVAISQLWGDGEVVIAGVVQDVRTRRLAGGRRSIVIAVVRDDSGSISASWFNQPWLLEKLVPGTPVRLRGKLGKLRVRREELRPRRQARHGRLRARSTRPARRCRRRGFASWSGPRWRSI